VARRSGYATEAEFKRRYVAFAHFKEKGYVVKSGLQFGTDFLLYRGSPDEFHAEYCALVLAPTDKVTWKRIKTLARLAQDVRKRLVLAHVDEDGVHELVIDDAFQQPADSYSGRKEAISNEARKQHSPQTPEPLTPGAYSDNNDDDIVAAAEQLEILLAAAEKTQQNNHNGEDVPEATTPLATDGV